MAEYKDSDTFQEKDGVASFVDSIGELNYVFKIGDKVPATVVFAESIDREKADEIMAGIEFTLRE